MAYNNRVLREQKVVKRIFVLTIILFVSMVMVSGVGCKKKVETKKVKARETVQIKTTVIEQGQDKKIEEGNISEDLLQDSSEEKKEKEEIKTSTGFFYDPEDRKDPFIPLIVKKTEDKKTKVVQNAPPLESYDVKEFRVIATAASTNNEFFALLLAPDNKSYTVTEGTKLGFNMGKIKEINMHEVVVEEYEEDYLNELKLKKVTLKLRRDDT